MQRKIGRQSDLIRSLEQSEAARSTEIENLKKQLADKDEEMSQIRDKMTASYDKKSLQMFNQHDILAKSHQSNILAKSHQSHQSLMRPRDNKSRHTNSMSGSPIREVGEEPPKAK